MDIFKLVGSVFVDTEAANDSLSKTDKKASSVGETLGKVGKGVATVGTAVIGASAAVGTAVVGMANESASAMDVVDKASQRMNISAESYQELAHAAGLSGVEMSTMEMAARKLEGTDLSLDDALDQIYALGTAEERSAKAAELFGDKVAYSLSPMLNSTADEMDAMRKEAHDLGLVFSEEDVKAGAVLNDTLANVQDGLGALVTSLGVSLMPIVQDVAEMIIEYLPMIQSMFDELSPILQTVFEQIMPPLMSLAETLMPIIFDLIEQLLPPIAQLLEGFMPVMITLLETIMPFVVNLASAVLPVIVNLMNALLPILQPLIELLNPILEIVIGLLQPMMDLINTCITPIIKLISEGLSKALEWLLTPIKLVKDAFNTLFKALPDLAKTAINALIWVLNRAIDGVNTILFPLRVIIAAVGDMFGAGWSISDVAIPNIPALAKGGQVTGAGAALVGEAGPELIEMPKGARVTPLRDGTLEDIANKLDLVIDALRSMAKMGVYINGQALVGEIAPGIDEELGRLAYGR